jgi:hypothetical protein
LVAELLRPQHHLATRNKHLRHVVICCVFAVTRLSSASVPVAFPYRRYLGQSCLDANFSGDLVETLNDPTNAAFSANHEGHRPWGADNLAGNVSEQHVRHRKAPNEWDNRHD